MNLKAGQFWTYQGREIDNESFLKIIRIDENCIHIAIKNIRVGDGTTDINHMPFTKEIIEKTVLELTGEENDFPELEGVAQWEAAQGGIFTISVVEAIEMVEKMIKENQQKFNDRNRPDNRN